jgi:hypothetical protein
MVKSCSFREDLGAVMPIDSRFRKRPRSSGRLTLVFLAICCLTISLATRFAVTGSETAAVRVVQAHSPDAQRQHLLGDGLKWTAPAVSFALFEPPRSFVPAVSAVFPATNLSFESWLYNRPPPNS